MIEEVLPSLWAWGGEGWREGRLQLEQGSSTFMAPGTGFTEDNFPMNLVGGREAGMDGWFGDDSSVSHLLCALFLLLHISFASDHQALDPGG